MTLPDRTPRSVALASSAIITGISAVVFFFIIYLLEKTVEWLWVVLFLGSGFVIAFLVIYFFIEQFLYRKVKIIYKTIHSLNTQNDRRSRIKMGSDILGTINAQVAEWAEEKIKEVKDLQAADTYRKEFIGNLAHELKTPIFNIQGYIDTLLEGDLDDVELNRKFLEKAARNCDRIADLIKDLDLISVIESGNIHLQVVRFDIVELVKKAIDSLEQQAAERNIVLRIKNPNERPIFVMADKSKIEQVLVNLLVNSINYGRKDGETKVRFYDMEDNILIEIADDGIGISKEHIPRIFERFYRVDKSRSRHEGGSGLGLAICKHIIESHQQTISARSTEDVGSTFAFTLKKA
jgi:two-component system, OmpR family, phosphate regulon sensor histidine kinase PhoR